MATTIAQNPLKRPAAPTATPATTAKPLGAPVTTPAVQTPAPVAEPAVVRGVQDRRVVGTELKAEANWGHKYAESNATPGVAGRARDNRLGLLATVSANAQGGPASATSGQRARALDTLSVDAAYTHDFVQRCDLSTLGIAGTRGATVLGTSDARPHLGGDARTEVEQGTKAWGGTLSAYGAHAAAGGAANSAMGALYRVEF